MMKELKTLSTLLTAVFSTALLVACGAATDGSGIEAALTDKTKPTIVQVEPNILIADNGDIVVPASTKNITFIFSEALDPNSIPADNTLNFITSTGQALKGNWTYSETSQPTLTFTFDLSSLGEGITTLPTDETFTLNFINTITDLAGNGVDFSISFQTVQTYDIGLKTAGLDSKTIEVKVTYENGSTPFTITGNGDSTIFAKLPENTDFTLSIETQPDADTFCAFSNTTGTILNKDSSVEINCSNVVPYYSKNSPRFDAPQDVANWNSYIKPDEFKPFVHAGERRKFTISSGNTCDNLAPAVDTLNAFNWACETVDNQTVIYSTGLKEGKYLSDLLDFSARNWLKNSVSVSLASNGTLVESTGPAIWWNNPIIVPEAGYLANFEAIYILTGDANDPSLNRPYTLSAKHVALVVDPTAVLTVPPSSSAAITVNSTSTGSWIEGKVNTNNATAGLVINGGFYTNVRNFEVYYAKTNGIELKTSEQVHLIDVTARDNTFNGIVISSAPFNANPSDLFGNVIRNATLNDNMLNGLLIESTKSNNRLSNITASNNGKNTESDSSGVSLSSNNILTNSILASTVGNALTINGQNNIVTMVSATSDSGNGIYFTESVVGTPLAESNFLSSVDASNIDSDAAVDMTSNTLVNSVDLTSATIDKNANGYPAGFSDYTQIGGNIITYLDAAVETFFDNSGNDNGLCEANETCLFTPNTGRAQGTGDLQMVGDNTSVWGLEGITLKEYSTNN